MKIKDDNGDVIFELRIPLTPQAIKIYLDDAYTPQEIAAKHGMTVNEVIALINEYRRDSHGHDKGN